MQECDRDAGCPPVDNSIELVPRDSIRAADENASLYSGFSLKNADDYALYESVLERGIIEPIVIDLEGVILSGHRRHNAAYCAESSHVPIRRESFRLSDINHAERIRILAAYNAQRNKTGEEQAREALVTVSPVDAWEALRERISDREATGRKAPATAMQIKGTIRRARITDAKQPMLDAIQAVIETMRGFWPLSVRQVHYGLLNNPPLVNATAKKRKFRCKYANNRKSYKALVELCARARLTGVLPWEAIADETRPVELWRTHACAADYVREESRYILGCYRRNLLQGQSRHVEIVVEKNTAAEIVRRVADEYTIPVTSGRGFCSLEPRRQIVERFENSGKSGLVLIVVSDADPDGDEIAESLVRSLRDDFNVEAVYAVRAALTPGQAAADGLPPNTDAKTTSPNFKKYLANHGGSSVYELEAVPPERLQQLVRNAIESVLDMEAYRADVEAWKVESAEIETVRRLAVDAVLKVQIWS